MGDGCQKSIGSGRAGAMLLRALRLCSCTTAVWPCPPWQPQRLCGWPTVGMRFPSPLACCCMAWLAWLPCRFGRRPKPPAPAALACPVHDQQASHAATLCPADAVQCQHLFEGLPASAWCTASAAWLASHKAVAGLMCRAWWELCAAAWLLGKAHCAAGVPGYLSPAGVRASQPGCSAPGRGTHPAVARAVPAAHHANTWCCVGQLGAQACLGVAHCGRLCGGPWCCSRCHVLTVT